MYIANILGLAIHIQNALDLDMRSIHNELRGIEIGSQLDALAQTIITIEEGLKMDKIRVLVFNMFKVVAVMGFVLVCSGFYYTLKAIQEAGGLYLMENAGAVELFGFAFFLIGVGCWALIIAILIVVNLTNKVEA